VGALTGLEAADGALTLDDDTEIDAARPGDRGHCGWEQIVVSMRKFDCVVWRSAWNTSRVVEVDAPGAVAVDAAADFCLRHADSEELILRMETWGRSPRASDRIRWAHAANEN